MSLMRITPLGTRTGLFGKCYFSSAFLHWSKSNQDKGNGDWLVPYVLITPVVLTPTDRKGGGKIDGEDDDDDDEDEVCWLMHFGIGVDSNEEYL